MRLLIPCALLLVILAGFNVISAIGMEHPVKDMDSTAVDVKSSSLPPRNLIDQTHADADAKSVSCNACHHGIEDMHSSPNVVLGCIDCHGGNASEALKVQYYGFEKDKTIYDAFEKASHVTPQNPEFWTGAKPVNSTVLLNHETPEFIRFVNPGDLRVAEKACGLCHGAEAADQGTINPGGDMVARVSHSMMNHGAMLWAAAAYNNGSFFLKNPLFGQDYGPTGDPLVLLNPFKPTAEQTRKFGWLPELLPLPRFELGQPGNVFRVFEKGGDNPPTLGLPNPEDDPGKPLNQLSSRGFGTNIRIDPVVLNAQKTRLNDPLLGFYGSNDHPGDYRSSGCTSCHVIYANDRSPFNSGWYSKYGNQGLSYSMDPTIPKNVRGHPIKHQFTTAIPSSQCMPCHMHQGNLFVNPYLGYIWWDQETDSEPMFPTVQKDPTPVEAYASYMKNPEGAAARGLWGNLDFLEKVAEQNPKLHNTQFADYHGHGWNFRAIFKKDRHGNLLDADNKIILADDPEKFAKAVHLKDIHLEKGMQCVDCHFLNDSHGNGIIYGEPRNATAIECIDCHGTVDKRPTLITSGKGGDMDDKDPDHKIIPINIGQTVTAWGPRFVWVGNKLYQQSAMSPDIRWEVQQTMDVIDPSSPNYNAKARYAKTIYRDGKTWGDVPITKDEQHAKLAHNNDKMDCQICHSSWVTSCFGCHMPMRANERVITNKFEGTVSRNFTTYNPQVVRDDVFMLGLDGTVKDNKLAVIRSSSAMIVGSQNSNREWVYSQQQTVSSEGYSGQAFNPHFPHTTSGVNDTKNCTDCHLSQQKDNNAIMAQLLGFGTGNVNFFGRYAYVATGAGGFYSVVWTEQDEPQAAIGSHFQKVAYPRDYDDFVAHNRILDEGDHKNSMDPFGGHILQDISLRGEYLYTAAGKGGLEVYDVAQVDQKGFSEKITMSPQSPLGQRTYVRTPFATSVTLPSTLMEDPKRQHLPANEEQPIHPLYGYVYVTDLKEGLVIVDVTCLFDGDPQNNYLHKDVVFNPEGKLDGAMKSYVAGHYLYVACKRGIEIVDINDPLKPSLVGEYAGDFLNSPFDVGLQFQYLFVADADGMKVLNIEDPLRPVPVPNGVVRLAHPHRLYVARDYVYMAGGADGIAIIDIERPEQPRLFQTFNAGGAINDARDVKIGSISASMFALVADGKNGFRVIQLISPDTVPEAAGFDPKPNPILIATYPVKSGEAMAISRGLDRDRVVDETANQTVVFGRRGSRPFHLDEMAWFLRHRSDLYNPDLNAKHDGDFFRVSDVQMKDGVLMTSTGDKILDPLAPIPVAPPEPPSDLVGERIMERPK